MIFIWTTCFVFSIKKNIKYRAKRACDYIFIKRSNTCIYLSRGSNKNDPSHLYVLYPIAACDEDVIVGSFNLRCNGFF